MEKQYAVLAEISAIPFSKDPGQLEEIVVLSTKVMGAHRGGKSMRSPLTPPLENLDNFFLLFRGSFCYFFSMCRLFCYVIHHVGTFCYIFSMWGTFLFSYGAFFGLAPPQRKFLRAPMSEVYQIRSQLYCYQYLEKIDNYQIRS